MRCEDHSEKEEYRCCNEVQPHQNGSESLVAFEESDLLAVGCFACSAVSLIGVEEEQATHNDSSESLSLTLDYCYQSSQD